VRQVGAYQVLVVFPVFAQDTEGIVMPCAGDPVKLML
jgi:hypothetical protein